MEPLSHQALEIIASYFRLLANATRLDLLQRVCHEERCVGELTEMTGQHQSSVSKHLGQLHRAGLVRRRTSGGQVFYSLARDALLDVCDAMRKIALDAEQERRDSLSEGV